MGPNNVCHYYIIYNCDFDQINISLKCRITSLTLKVVIWPPREHMVELEQSKPVVGGTIPAESDANSFAASNDACGSPAAQYVVTGPNLDFNNIFECEQFQISKHYNNQIQS